MLDRLQVLVELGEVSVQHCLQCMRLSRHLYVGCIWMTPGGEARRPTM